MMVYCKKCGKEISEDAEFCPGCGVRQHVDELVLASWGERFVALVIDSLLVGIVAGMVASPLGWHAPFPFLNVGVNSVFLFLYWTYLEGTEGQSLGKRAMKIRVVDLHGEPIDMSTSMYQAVGKAFIMPLDVIVGWLLYPAKQQRLFNYLSGTIVVKD